MLPVHNGKLNLFEALALEASALLKPLLRVGEFLAFFNKKPERDPMNSIRLALEAEDRYEQAVILSLQLLLRDSFRNQCRVVIDADDCIISWQLASPPVVARLIHTHRAGLFFTGKFGLLDQALDQVTDVSGFVHQDIILLLSI